MDEYRHEDAQKQGSEHNGESFKTFLESLNSHFGGLIEKGKSALRNEQRHVRNLEKELEECKESLEAKERELDLILGRMAFHGDKRTKQDQREVEDTLSLNRQSQVERDYRIFSSQKRIDAVVVIRRQLKGTEFQARRLACAVFETTYEYVLATKKAMIEFFEETSKHLVREGPNIVQRCSEDLRKAVERKEADPKKAKKHMAQPMLVTVQIPPVQIRPVQNHLVDVPLRRSDSEYPRDVLDGLNLSIKEAAPRIDTKHFIKGVKNEIFETLSDKSHSEESWKELLKSLDDYIEACVKLTWRMVTQLPPLSIEYQIFAFDKDLHTIEDPRSEVRAERCKGKDVRYLWPVLLDGGKRIIHRGLVIFKEKL